jgi:hypothetical protein
LMAPDPAEPSQVGFMHYQDVREHQLFRGHGNPCIPEVPIERQGGRRLIEIQPPASKPTTRKVI